MDIVYGDKIYIESQSMNVQGKANDIYKKYGKEWNIKALGNVYCCTDSERKYSSCR